LAHALTLASSPLSHQTRSPARSTADGTPNLPTLKLLNILQWNVSGLSSNTLVELKNCLNKNNIDICAIQETILQPSKTLRIPGYNIILKDRETAARIAGRDVKNSDVITLIKDGHQILTCLCLINKTLFCD
jgi:hypothetical protein